MTRKNKILFILSFFIILAPIAIGLILWDKLFATVGSAGASTVYITVLLPLLFLVLHLLCVGTMLHDYHKNGQSEKIVTVSICLVPAITLFASVIVYTTLLTGNFVPYSLLYVLLGVMFILMGNYMPKAKRNRYFGVKTPWTLASDDIWMRTHRFSGKVGVITGAILLLCALLPQDPTVLVVSVLATAIINALASTVYSYVLFKKAVSVGELSPNAASVSKKDKAISAATIPLIVAVLAVCAVLMTTGSIAFTVGEDALTVDPTYWGSEEIAYGDIASLQLIEDDAAHRISGFGSPVLSLGLFSSEEHGKHTRLAYSDAEKLILLTLKDGTKVILGEKSTEETAALYEALIEKIS